MANALNIFKNKTMEFPMNAEKRTIGPKEAAMFLAGNENNRKVRTGNLIQISRDMKSGNFDSANGQTIVINSKSQLIDGQHRMMAIVNTNTEHDFLVVTNDDPNVGDRIDQGASRNLTDMLYMDSCPDPAIINSTIRMLKADDSESGKKQSEYSLSIWAQKAHPELRRTWLSHKDQIISAYNASGQVLTKPEFLYYLYKLKISDNDKTIFVFNEFLAYLKAEPKGVKAPSQKFKYCLDALRDLKSSDLRHKDKKDLRMAMIDYLCQLESGQISKDTKWGRVASKKSFRTNASAWLGNKRVSS